MSKTIPESSTTPVPVLQLTHVSKQYGTAQPVIDDLSIEISRGECVSIIGPSGCGKSTLLKLIAGLTNLSSGAITIEGMTPVNAREIMSFIFQDPTLLPWRTVRANIGLGLELEHVTTERRESRVDSLLQTVGLAHVADSYPRQLSGGMKMRVSIARALASRPRILLLDEPFAALDELTRDRMNEELLRLQREHGWTVVFVTHSVAEAVFLSTRVLILAPHPGRVIHDIKVDLPSIRDTGIRRSGEYDALVASVSRKLREAIPV